MGSSIVRWDEKRSLWMSKRIQKIIQAYVKEHDKTKMIGISLYFLRFDDAVTDTYYDWYQMAYYIPCWYNCRGTTYKDTLVVEAKYQDDGNVLVTSRLNRDGILYTQDGERIE